MNKYINGNYLKNLLFLLPSFAVLIAIAYLLCKHKWYEETTSEVLWGLFEQKDQNLNKVLFVKILIPLIAIYIGIALIPFLDHSDKKTFKKRVLWQYFVLSIIFYFAGLFTPLYETEKLKIFGDQVSLWESVDLLFDMEEVYLGVLVFTFTILFPVIKFIALFVEFLNPYFYKTKLFRIFTSIGKFSMLDVFVIAVFLLNMKFGSVILNMNLEEGIVFFSISIILSMILFNIKREKVYYEGI